MNRRKYLAVTGGVIVVAGCSSDGDNGESQNEDTETTEITDTPQDTAEEEGESSGDPEFEIASLDYPQNPMVNETVSIEITVENIGDGTGDFESELHLGGPTGIFELDPIELEAIEPGGTSGWIIYDIEFEEAGDYHYWIDTLEEEFVIEVQPLQIILEYTITADKTPEQVPEDIHKSRSEGGRRQEGYKWVVVEFEVVEERLNMEDLWFRSSIETSNRLFDLDHATGDLVDGIQSRGDIKQGGSGIGLYQVPEDADTFEWNLEETQQNIEAKKVD